MPALCGARSPAAGGAAARARRRRRSLRNQTRAGSRAALALDAAGALRALRVVVRPRRSAARSTRPAFAAGRPGRRRAMRSPRRWAAASGAERRRPDARGRRRRPTCVGDLIAKIDIATMAHALEARSPFLDHELMELAASIPADAQGPRRARRSGSCARRCAAGCPTTSSTARSRASRVPLVELAARRPARMVARRPARPRDARPRLLPPRRGHAACSTATPPAPTATPSGSGRC